MKAASSSPRPYLLNRAGGISKVKEFSLVGTQLNIVAVDEKPRTGVYQLVYRCANHEHADIKWSVQSDGTSWSLMDSLPAGEESDICYPPPCDLADAGNGQADADSAAAAGAS